MGLNMTDTTHRHLLWLATQPGFEGLQETCPGWSIDGIIGFHDPLPDNVSGEGCFCNGLGYILPSAPECLWRLVDWLSSHIYNNGADNEPLYEVGRLIHTFSEVEDNEWPGPEKVLALHALGIVRALGGPE